MADRFPGYDVLAKRDGPSWNPPTRAVIDERLALSDEADLLDPRRRATLRALAARIVPQPEGRAAVNAAAMVLVKIAQDDSDGYRPAALPRVREAWTRGLDAIEGEALVRHGRSFADLDGPAQDALLTAVESGKVATDWNGLDPKLLWQWRIVPDLVSAYWAHPSAWSAMGFGGPASPRGYVRLGSDQRDPWEAAEQGDGAPVPASIRNGHVR